MKHYSENIAKNFLIQQGYKFIGENIRCSKIEIDLIFEYCNTIILVEVKKRNKIEFFQISKAQRRNINNFIAIHFPNRFVQIDIVLITDKITHLKNIYL